MNRALAVLLACLLAAVTARAAEPFVVKDIRVEGLNRIEAGTVFNYLPIKVGDTVTDAATAHAIKTLFKTGFFQDVRLSRSGDTLIVTVEERPSIDSIKLSGAKEIKEDDLKKGLKDAGLAEGRVFDASTLDRIEQELKRQYFARGRYGVKIKTTVTPLERNRVAIAIDVAEGKVARIRQVNIIGNRAFTDKELNKIIKLSPSTLFSFFTKNDQYSKPQLSADLESLRAYYQNRGYLEFAIQSTQVSITPDKQEIYITVGIAEGERFTVGAIKLSGELIVPEPDLRKLIAIAPGDVFSREKITDAVTAISNRLGEDGYAFANVNPIPDIDREKHAVSFTFFVDPGKRVYVRRIVFQGNRTTLDDVLRREMRQFEGAWYSTSKVRRSRERLNRLGIFDEVNIETPAVPGHPDQVDVVVTVKERLVNNFLASVGYSDLDGLLLNASVTFRNLLGTGKQLEVSIDNSSYRKTYNLGFLDPYHTIHGVSRRIDIYSTSIDAARANTAAYTADTRGVGVLYGIPIREDRTVSLGLAYEGIDITTNTLSARVATDFVAANGPEHGVFRGTVGWALDTLDNPIFPNQGVEHRVTAEIALPGSDLEYYRLSYNAAAFVPFGQRFTWKNRGEVAHGDGYGDTADLPFYKNYYAGGSSTVRGYKARALGPLDVGGPNPALPIGGNSRVLLGTELLFPVPGQTRENKSTRFGLFVDGGMVYGPGENVDFGELRYAAGLAFYWFAPVGPISLSVATPFNDQAGDRTEVFQFTLGQQFR
jgi:outer membrane protein insertion porin family